MATRSIQTLGVDIIIDKIDKVVNKIESGLDNAEKIVDKVIDAFFLVSKTGLNSFDKFSDGFMETIYSLYDKNSETLRKLSRPYSKIYPSTYKFIMKRKIHKIPLLRPGVQMVRARVGGGKSLTSWVLASMVLKKTGHPSYMTSAVEKPKLSEDGKYWYVYHPVIDLDDYYAKGKKLKRFNTKKYKNMHKDEYFLRYNVRMNKTREYNEKFIPEHKDELVMRHDGFETITKYGQHNKLDTQDMETLDLMHEVETVKDIPYKQWLKDGKYNYIPVKLKFTSYSLDVQFDGTIKRRLFKKWHLDVPYEVLQEFDTYAEANKSDGLPLDFK